MIIEKIRNIAEQNPSKIALRTETYSITYKELHEEILKWASHLSTYNQVDTFLFELKNQVENVIGLLASNYLGKKGIILGSTTNQHEIQSLLKLNNSILIDSNDLSKNEIGSPYKSGLKTIFLGVLSSGSLRLPKIIWKDYQSWVKAFPKQQEVFGTDENSNLFCLDAMAYSANLNFVLQGLYFGNTVVLGSLKRQKSWSNLIKKNKVNSLFLVPSHIPLLLPNLNECKETIKTLVCAGEKLNPSLAKEVIAFKNIDLIEYYGTAELGHITFHKNEDILKFPQSVGKPFPGVKVKINEGKIYVESDFVSPEYRKSPTANDIGKFENGRLILLGRQGRIFNKRGLNIHAEEIEAIASSFAEVEQTVLLEVKNKLLLCFTSKVENSSSAMKKFIQSKLKPEKWPNIVKQIDFIPHTESGKINYKELQKIFDEKILVELG